MKASLLLHKSRRNLHHEEKQWIYFMLFLERSAVVLLVSVAEENGNKKWFQSYNQDYTWGFYILSLHRNGYLHLVIAIFLWRVNFLK